MLGLWGDAEDDDSWEEEEDGEDGGDDHGEGGGPFNMITQEGSSEEDYYGDDYDLQNLCISSLSCITKEYIFFAPMIPFSVCEFIML